MKYKLIFRCLVIIIFFINTISFLFPSYFIKNFGILVISDIVSTLIIIIMLIRYIKKNNNLTKF